MSLRNLFLILLGIGMMAGLSGCGSGGQTTVTQPPPAVSVTIRGTPPTKLSVNETSLLLAEVLNGSTSLVNWSVNCGSTGACGSFNPTQTQNGSSNTTTKYTAPSAVPSGSTVTITAKSVADPTKSASFTVTITAAPPPPITITFTGTVPSSMQVNTQVDLSARVTNDPNSQPFVNWTVSAGSIIPNETLTDVQTVYQAPATIPSSGTVTVTATSVTDPTKSISAVITILPLNPVTSIVVTLSAVPSYLQVSATDSMSASIANDPNPNPQVTWTVACAAVECGSFNPTTTASNVATTYTAPSAIPTGNTVTVTATSVTDPTKSASATITLLNNPSPPSLMLANGYYIFQLAGPPWTSTDGSYGALSGAGFTTGVFHAMDGNIIGGEQDYVIYTGGDDSCQICTYSPSQSFNPIIGGSYTTYNGDVAITLLVGNKAGNWYEYLGGALVSSSKGTAVQLMGDSISVEAQTSIAAPSGGYAIYMYGGDQYSNPTWMGGILNIDSPGGISGTGSILDVNGTTIDSEGGTVGTPDQYGRVEILLNSTPSAPLTSSYLYGYIVDATHIRLISSSMDALGDNDQGVMAGLALGQGANTGNFSTSSIAGSSYVFGTGSESTVGFFTANAGGTVSGEINDYNNTAQTPLAITGSWTVDPAGRLILSNLNYGSNDSGSMNLYLTGDGNALMQFSDSSSAVPGQAFQRQTGPFTASTFSGNYVLNGSNSGYEWCLNDLWFNDWWLNVSSASNGTDTVAGFSDSVCNAQESSFTGSFTPTANGVFTGSITGFGNINLYVVDNTRAVLIGPGNGNNSVWGVLQLQQ